MPELNPQSKLLSTIPDFDGCTICHTSKRIFFLKGFLSQWYQSKFVCPEEIFGETLNFSNCEQFMMATKARVMDDMASFDKIMATTNPRTAKELGRKVANFDPKLWDAMKFDLVVLGNTMKFKQNEKFGILLKLTQGYSLFEANAFDSIWGIGWSLEHSRLLEISESDYGKNLLGKCLMEVRKTLLEFDPRYQE